MDTRQMSAFFRCLARGMAAKTMGDQSDAQLVERFLTSRDDTVFEAIVRRHGPMIFRVCWRVLQDEQEAEDALQATLLVLAQKLHSVRKRTSLASWLHGVAHRVALKAKTQVASRERHERKASVSGAVASDDITWKELRTVLDAELSQMSEKWRLPLILCYLEGRTQDEAAAQLGCGERTLRRRLDEARAALGRRLSRRGIVWPAAFCSVLLSECVATAAMKLEVVRSTVEVAAHVLAGQGTTAIVPAKVAALAEGVMKAMFISQLKVVVAILLALGVVAGGVGALTQTTLAAKQPDTGAAAQVKGEKPPADDQKTPPGKEADKPKTDKERFQGTWQCVSVSGGGETIKVEDFGQNGLPGTVKFDGDKLLSRDFNSDGKVVETKGSFKLDPSRKPKEIDLIYDPEAKVKSARGIYELEGDSLRLCFPGSPDKDRPTKLESKKGERYMLMTYKRVAKIDADMIELEKKRFKGTWQFASYEVDGKKLTKADIEELVVRPKMVKAAQAEGRKLTIGNIGGVFLVYDASGKWKLQTAGSGSIARA